MRNLDQTSITEAVLASQANTEDPRLRQIMTSLVQHLHAFAREVRLTEAEWLLGVEFLTRCGNITDGNASSYWEGPKNTFPATVTVDLGRPSNVGRVVLRLPPLDVWNTRSQTLSISGSADRHSFRTLKVSGRLTFDPSAGNAVTVRFPAQSVRYLRVSVTANTGWPAGQLSELQAFGG